MTPGQLVFAGLSRRRLYRTVATVGWIPAVCAAWMALIVVVAVFGPWITPHDPDPVDLYNAYAPSSLAHPLGTDESGRDILSRLIVATGPSLLGPALVATASALFGTLLAVTAAWFGGWADAVLSRTFDIMFALPGLIIAIFAVAIFGPGLTAPVIALSIAYVPVIGRVLRAAATRERNLPYVAALTVQGASKLSICLRHVIPNLLPLLTVQFGLVFSYAIIDLGGISYLGLGLQPPASDWGSLVASGQNAIMAGYPTQALAAGAVILITVVSANLLSDRLTQALEMGER
ncbi:ABC transporter permease [Streptomyces sp. NPDC002896]|uniref:ABC transporter permease n=1 Tax=Streptomyces sp. NPDC002896 TaxID=3154438 RepID=UPI00332199F7